MRESAEIGPMERPSSLSFVLWATVFRSIWRAASINPQIKSASEKAHSIPDVFVGMSDQETAEQIKKTPDSFGTASACLVAVEKIRIKALSVDGATPALSNIADGVHIFAGKYPYTTRQCSWSTRGIMIKMRLKALSSLFSRRMAGSSSLKAAMCLYRESPESEVKSLGFPASAIESIHHKDHEAIGRFSGMHFRHCNPLFVLCAFGIRDTGLSDDRNRLSRKIRRKNHPDPAGYVGVRECEIAGDYLTTDDRGESA
ncbi:MAG: hypothetical protein V1766_13485 [Pseudomonadota bacterium]